MSANGVSGAGRVTASGVTAYSTVNNIDFPVYVYVFCCFAVFAFSLIFVFIHLYVVVVVYVFLTGWSLCYAAWSGRSHTCMSDLSACILACLSSLVTAARR